MGKKKSKTGKQRQAKAKVKSLQSKKLQFHVPISKAGQLLPVQSSKLSSSSSTLDHSNLKQSKNDKRNMIRMGSNSKHDTKKKSPLNTWKSEEDKAYEQEYLSLQERQYHAQINKMSSKKKKDISLTPASLQLKMDQPPTAEELIQDTAQKLDGIMSFSNTTITTSSSSSSNSNHTLANHHNPPNLLQILAAQKRQEQYMISTTTQTNKNEENKFWVLQQDEDDDSEDEMTTRNDTSKTSNVPVFQFAAPSFSVPLANQPTNAVDDDPDL